MFKNATFYRFPPATGMDILCRLSDAIKLLPLLELEPAQMSLAGFEGDTWIGMACYGTIAVRSRVISLAMVCELLAKRVKEREDAEGRRIGSKERRRMKEEIIVDLMPHSPVVTKRTECLVHAGENWIAINTASPRVAENCIGMIRMALGSFPATPLAPAVSPTAMLTGCLGEPDNLPAGWMLTDACVLIDEGKAKASYRNQPLPCDETFKNLQDGKNVQQLGLCFDSRVEGVLTTDLVLKSIKFLDGAGIDDAEDMAQVMALQALELERVAHDLFSIFQCETPE